MSVEISTFTERKIDYMDTNILEQVLNEITELKEFKKLYGSQKKDKQKMSDELYKLMMYKYNAEPLIDRKSDYEINTCSCCRFEDWCNKDNTIPKDIGLPIKSENAWIPSTKGCGKFKWD